MDPMLRSAISTGLGIFLASAVVLPAWDKYKAWKNDPLREKVARRNWRGQWVPDLGLIRMERAIKGTFFAIVIFGVVLLMALPNVSTPH